MQKVLYDVVTDEVTPTLHDLRGSLSGDADQRLGHAIAGNLETMVRAHVRAAAPARHKTANRLGARPTGHLAKAVATIETTVNGSGEVSVSFFDPIFKRAYGDVQVNAKSGKALSIPAHADAYGRRPREIGGLRLAIFLGKKKAALVKVEGSKSEKPLIFQKGGGPKKYGPQTKAAAKRSAFIGPRKERKKLKMTVYYWLKKSVLLPQDRGLLPSDDEFGQAMEQGAQDFLDMEARKRGIA